MVRISAWLKEILLIPMNAGGLGTNTIKSLAKKSRLVKRSILKKSKDSDINVIWEESRSEFVESDVFLTSHESTKVAKKRLKQTQQSQAIAHLDSLTIQGAASARVRSEISKSDISNWSTVMSTSAGVIHNFARKALLQSLPTAGNLFLWKKTSNPYCPLCNCGVHQSNKHVLSNCASPTALRRYTSRHDEILMIIVMWLKSVTGEGQEVFADINYSNTKSTNELFSKSRPDIAISSRSSISVLELTICHETNLRKSKDYKLDKYRHLIKEVTTSLTGCLNTL